MKSDKEKVKKLLEDKFKDIKDFKVKTNKGSDYDVIIRYTPDIKDKKGSDIISENKKRIAEFVE